MQSLPDTHDIKKSNHGLSTDRLSAEEIAVKNGIGCSEAVLLFCPAITFAEVFAKFCRTKSSGGITAGTRKRPPAEGLTDFAWMPPTALQADSGSSCQPSFVTQINMWVMRKHPDKAFRSSLLSFLILV